MRGAAAGGRPAVAVRWQLPRTRRVRVVGLAAEAHPRPRPRSILQHFVDVLFVVSVYPVPWRAPICCGRAPSLGARPWRHPRTPAPLSLQALPRLACVLISLGDRRPLLPCLPLIRPALHFVAPAAKAPPPSRAPPGHPIPPLFRPSLAHAFCLNPHASNPAPRTSQDKCAQALES